MKATLTVHVRTIFGGGMLKDACTVWEGVRVALGWDEWRGLLPQAFDGHYGYSSIRPDPNGERPYQGDVAPCDLLDLGTGLPVSRHLRIATDSGSIPLIDASLVSIDVNRRRGVIEHRVLTGQDGQASHLSPLCTLFPQLRPERLGKKPRAFIVFEWDWEYQVWRSVIVMHYTDSPGEVAKTFSAMSYDERANLVAQLDTQ